jgi:hypothetical protein
MMMISSIIPTQMYHSATKRENLDINFQRDLLEESKREELETDLVGYAGYDGGGDGGSGTS